MPASAAAGPKLTLQSIIQKDGRAFLRKHPHLAFYKQDALKELAACRTGACGSHLRYCDKCGYEEERPNSCRNRHCPTCGAPRRARWLEKLLPKLFSTSYLQVVFTLPHQLIPLLSRYPYELYELLFRTAWETLQTLAADPQHLGATLGALAVLHTWNQELGPHPHAHFVLPAGGVSLDGQRWVPCKRRQGQGGQPGGYYLFPHQVISKLFRGKFLDGLKQLINSGVIPLDRLPPSWQTLDKVRLRLSELYGTKWVVYQAAPPPDLEPAALIKYLARYVSGTAIQDARLVGREGDQISFTVKNRKTGAREVRSLPVMEFLDRYLLHVLPPGLTRVRYYGFMASNSSAQREHAKALCAAAGVSAAGAATALSPAAAPIVTPAAPVAPAAEAAVALERGMCPHCHCETLELIPLFREKSWRVRRRQLVRGPFVRFRDGPVVIVPDDSLSPPGVGPPPPLVSPAGSPPLRQLTLPFVDLAEAATAAHWGSDPC